MAATSPAQKKQQEWLAEREAEEQAAQPVAPLAMQERPQELSTSTSADGPSPASTPRAGASLSMLYGGDERTRVNQGNAFIGGSKVAEDSKDGEGTNGPPPKKLGEQLT
jgi:hypothetical protein